MIICDPLESKYSSPLLFFNLPICHHSSAINLFRFRAKVCVRALVAVMARFAPLLAAILSSSLLLRSPAEASIFCARRKLLSARGVHYTFLRNPPQQAPPSLRLYQGSWSHGRALLSCAWSDDAAVIRDYLSVCRERAREFSDHLEESLDIDSAFGAEDPCVSLAAPNLGGPPGKRSLRSVDSSPPGARENGSKGRSLHRVKRGFIVPGTLWCGSGNKAPSFGDLGRFLPQQKSFSLCPESRHVCATP